MNQTDYVHGVDGFDGFDGKEEEEDSEEEEERDEEEYDEDEDEGEDIKEEVEEESMEEFVEDVDEVVENNGACDEPSKSLQRLARVAVNHLEEGTRAGEPIDLKHSNSVDHDPENDTSNDDYYGVIVDNNNNNTDLGHEEVEILTDDDKENEPVIKTVRTFDLLAPSLCPSLPLSKQFPN
ncbi:MAG: hypothetical protein BYD32DRAFT_467572 [Podila humilis]|nr:MAG: hypothetical protein BYD32DRAFT_467572 [Podila humilis]